MAIQRTCDVCQNAVRILDYDPADCYATPSVVLCAPGVGRSSIETCLDCLKTIVRALGERFPSAPPNFASRTRNFLRGLTDLEEADQKWRRDHTNPEEG